MRIDRFEVWDTFFIIWENSKIEKYIINGFYTHTWENQETKEIEIKTYYVYQKSEVIMTIWENYMYSDLESVKTEAIRLLDQEVEKIETIRKDILETNI